MSTTARRKNRISMSIALTAFAGVTVGLAGGFVIGQRSNTEHNVATTPIGPILIPGVERPQSLRNQNAAVEPIPLRRGKDV